MSDFVNSVDSIGDEALTGSIIDRSITEILDNYVTSIGNSAFDGCSSLTTADFPAVTTVGDYAFNGCSRLATVDLPAATTVGGNAFNGCSRLTTADFPAVVSISAKAFYSCSKLASLVLRSEVMATLDRTNALAYTPITSGTGYIYVPAALVDSYKAANNWSSYANQFRAIEDYTVDGTTTGALDASKI